MRSALAAILIFFQRVLRFLVRKLGNLEKRVRPPDASGSRHLSSVVRSTAYDMAAEANEVYYRQQYEYWIEPALATLAPETVLDLGCGQGRFLGWLAQRFPNAQVTGVDISPGAIDQARANTRSLANVGVVVSEICAFLKEVQTSSIDLVFMTEVTFFYPAWMDAFREICRVVRPGAIVVMSFRSQYYYALALVNNGAFEELETVSVKRQANLQLFGSSDLVFTWQTSDEIRKLFADPPGFELLSLAGIGCLSGIKFDPHQHMAEPAQLSKTNQERLRRLETDLGPTVPDAGRYILAVARKH